MTAATLSRAEFLKSQERTIVVADATLQARWGDSAGDTRQSSSLTGASDASTEASRQLALLGSVMAEDQVLLEGLFFDLDGRVVTISYVAPDGGNYFGGAGSVNLLVTASTVDPASGTTLVKGLIRL